MAGWIITPLSGAHLNSLIGCLSIMMLLFLSTGCDLLFEPPEKAIDRFLQAAAEKDNRELDEMIEGSEDYDQLLAYTRELAQAFNSSIYKRRANYWTILITGEDEEADRTFATITFEVPKPKGRKRRSRRANKPEHLEVDIAMQRVHLRWYIREIDNRQMDKVLSKMQKAANPFSGR